MARWHYRCRSRARRSQRCPPNSYFCTYLGSTPDTPSQPAGTGVPLNPHLLVLVERGFIVAPIVQLRGARGGVIRRTRRGRPPACADTVPRVPCRLSLAASPIRAAPA